MRKKFITLMMIFTSLGAMYISANADTSHNKNPANSDIGMNQPLQQTRYIRYRGGLYRVNVQRVGRYRRYRSYRSYRPRARYYRTYNRRYYRRSYRPRIRYIRIPRVRYYRTYNRRYYRPRYYRSYRY